MTKKANSLGIYADVKNVLDQALANGGGNYTLTSHGAAVHWRQRAYKFRQLWRNVHGPTKLCPYDTLSLRRVPPESSTIEIVLTSHLSAGLFTPAGVQPTSVDDDLMEYAKSLANKLDGV